MIWYTVNTIVFPLVVNKIFGFKGMIVFIAIAFVGILYLELINYIEHYGLLRKEIAKGIYEPVTI